MTGKHRATLEVRKFCRASLAPELDLYLSPIMTLSRIRKVFPEFAQGHVRVAQLPRFKNKQAEQTDAGMEQNMKVRERSDMTLTALGLTAGNLCFQNIFCGSSLVERGDLP